MIDLCKSATVVEDHSSTSADTSSCKVTGRTPHDNRYVLMAHFNVFIENMSNSKWLPHACCYGKVTILDWLS